jgi:ribosome-associated toxin RatA of RatAB toxin-antitoxin module
MKRCAVLVALLIVAGSPARANPVGLSDGEVRRLEHGEVVILDVLPPSGSREPGQGGTAVTFVHASPETVWRVLVDYPRHAELYPHVTSAEVLEADADRTLVRYVVGVGPFSFGFHVNNYPDAARGRLVWRLDRDRRNGLFHDTWGYWQVESRGEGVLLTYAMAARTMLPPFFTRGAERDGLVETVKAVRGRAEQSH